MTDYLIVVDQQFCIKQEKQDLALAALKHAIQEHPRIPVIGSLMEYPFPELRQAPAILQSNSLIEALACRNWVVTGLTNGAITTLTTEYYEKVDNDTEEYAFWSILAPFIEPGYLECETLENDHLWRWAFDGTRCHLLEPITIWPEL